MTDKEAFYYWYGAKDAIMQLSSRLEEVMQNKMDIYATKIAEASSKITEVPAKEGEKDE